MSQFDYIKEIARLALANDQNHLREALYDFVVLRTQHGSTEINHLKHQESQHDNLIDHPYGSHTVVRMAAQHNGIHRAKHHD